MAMKQRLYNIGVLIIFVIGIIFGWWLNVQAEGIGVYTPDPLGGVEGIYEYPEDGDE